MASAIARAYNGGLKAEPLAEFRGRTPGQGDRGQSPLKLKHFWYNESRKFVHFSKIWKRKLWKYLFEIFTEC